MNTYHDLRTGQRYQARPATRTRVVDMRTGRPHARHTKATARAVYGVTLRLGRR